MPAVAPGVHVLSVPVGGLTSEPARLRLESEMARSIPIERGTQRWWASPLRLGVGAAIDASVTAALSSPPGQNVEMHVTWAKEDVRRFVTRIAHRFDRDAVDATLIGVSRAGPVIRDAKPGIAVRQIALQRALERRLREGTRTPIALPTRTVRATRTRATFGSVIWIDRATNTLRLYDATKAVRTFGVATGRVQYPTPSGLFAIVDMQRNPWWTPPASPWAQGLKPVPPGPGNPLGTRWMGLSAAGVGIHGTPDAASIGYSASHGCIRMQIPDAEWLFAHVDVGTPVYIS